MEKVNDPTVACQGLIQVMDRQTNRSGIAALLETVAEAEMCFDETYPLASCTTAIW